MCLLLRNEVGELCVRSLARSHARSHDLKSYDYSVTIAFFFNVSSNKQIIVKKLFGN